MDRDSLNYKPTLKGIDLPWRVVAPCNVLYPNAPEKTHEGLLTVAYFFHRHDAEFFVDHSLSIFKYYIERNE